MPLVVKYQSRQPPPTSIIWRYCGCLVHKRHAGSAILGHERTRAKLQQEGSIVWTSLIVSVGILSQLSVLQSERLVWHNSNRNWRPWIWPYNKQTWTWTAFLYRRRRSEPLFCHGQWNASKGKFRRGALKSVCGELPYRISPIQEWFLLWSAFCHKFI